MKRQRLIAGELSVESVLETGPQGETLMVSRPGVSRRERLVLKWLPSTRRPDLAALAALSHPVLVFPTAFRLDTASGRKSKSEEFGYGEDEFAPWILGATM